MPPKTPPKPVQLLVPVADIQLTESDENPNHLSDADFRGLCEAISRLDFAQAVTLRKLPGQQLDVVDGNHRVRAARVACITELPALVYPEAMTDAQLRALRLALNRWRGDPRPDVVAADLRFLASEGWDREDLYAAAGWDRGELDLLLGGQKEGGDDSELPDIPDPGGSGSAPAERAPREEVTESPELVLTCSTAEGCKELRELLGRAARRAGARGKFRLEKAALWALRRALEED